MRSSRTITLFSDGPEPRQKPSAFVASMVVHGAFVAMVLLSFMYAPQFKIHSPDIYMLQHVDLNMPEPPIRRAGGSGSSFPSPNAAGSKTPSHEKLAAPPSSRLRLERRKLAAQTLVQPDVEPDKILPKETPLPALLLWSANKLKVKVITPPPPKPVTATFDKPKLNLPNKEVVPKDIAISSTNFQSKLPMPMPSNTSPIVVHQEAPIQRVPETSSVSTSQPTAAATLSASDIHLAQGSVPLPPANQSASGNLEGSLGTGQSAASLHVGRGDADSTGIDSGTGKTQGNASGAAAGTGNAGGDKGQGNGAGHGGAGSTSGNGHGAGPGAGQGAGQGTGKGAGQGLGEGEEGSVARITLPKNGQFGVVVVGSAVEDDYPEAAPVWKGRLAYSVYLHVGMAKSWILQYSLPRAGDSAESAATKLEAPWPYYIVRPNLNPDLADSDSVMVHGYVNESGHFEDMTVIFPNGLVETKLLLTALRQWQFRPGTQNGQIAKLEVLLIIPLVTD